ncbi:MAG TPA: carbonic anhydrase [Ktedonobacterales bacterium]|nr:carbonic anhydrase [Ktedonobacterales bacterium]
MAIQLNDLLEANARYANRFEEGALAMPPAQHLAIVTCMDARLEPLAFLGLRLGDAHVFRNAGGRVSEDALRSLVISERLLGSDAILVIHHTDCGMLTFTDEQLRDRVRDELGNEAYAVAAEMQFLPFADLEASVRDDLATIAASPLIPQEIPVYGLIYDVRTGRLQSVG